MFEIDRKMFLENIQSKTLTLKGKNWGPEKLSDLPTVQQLKKLASHDQAEFLPPDQATTL